MLVISIYLAIVSASGKTNIARYLSDK